MLEQQQHDELRQETIRVKLVENRHLFVDWARLPKYRNSRQFVVHCKSLNDHQVSVPTCFAPVRVTSALRRRGPSVYRVRNGM